MHSSGISLTFRWFAAAVVAGWLIACARAPRPAPALERCEASRPVPSCPAAAAVTCEARCVGGDGQACLEAGLARWRGDTAERDPAAAARLFSRGCDVGSGHACLRLALQLRRGAGVDQDEVLARAKLDQGCALGDGNSCAMVALELEEIDPPRAAAVYDRGCAACDGMSCANRAAMHLRSIVPGDSPARGIEQLEAVCGRMKVAAACGMLAEELRRGRFVSIDTERGDRLAAEACRAGFPPACPTPTHE